jgi:hypothetical protein
MDLSSRGKRVESAIGVPSEAAAEHGTRLRGQLREHGAAFSRERAVDGGTGERLGRG